MQKERNFRVQVSGSHASTDSGKGGLQTSSSISQTNKHSKTKKLNNNSSSASKLSSDDGVDCSSSTTTTTTIVQQLQGFNYDSHSNIPTCGESLSKNKWRKKSTKPPPSYLNHTNHKPRSRSYDQCTKRHDDVSSSQQLTNYNNVFNIPSNLDKHASSTSRLLEDGADNRSNFFSHSTPVNVLNRPISIQLQQEASSSRSVKQHKKKTANFGPPLSTLRLLATRKKTHKTMLTITKEGWVVIEFTQMFASNMYVTSVTFISGDGQQIKYFACKSGEEMLLRPDKPVVNLASPVPNVPCEVYTFNQLPKNLWNIYKYASQFVNTVRSVTPTVIYYTDKAKCMLMENNRFVANFYDGVTFTQLQSKMTITESDDRTTTLDVSASISQMLPDTQDRWNHVIEVYKTCRALVELLLVSNPKLSSSSPFPCFLGRQPTGVTIASSSTSAASKKNCGRSNSHASINNETTLSPFSIRSYSSSNVTATSTPTFCGRTCTSVDTFKSDSLASADASNRPSTTFDCQKQPHIKYLSLPDVGNVYEYPRGFFVIERLDETCILLDSQADSYTFKLKSGSTLTFCKVADVPSSYRRMLDDLPHILQLLAKTKPLTSFSS
ncbi:hypothetical protein HELRODRAFT_187844 [Helobdella robusta]|uniref:POLO box domain-containing protein n=1 Tax=Helobdella robusta TaxID=6412 RepID=T1FPF2_HELRO|nr:hypothetical protein HELRODRAFT_187844 [Helobdella robusta]ESO12347.1 hypothetical protein HELRODRAFT_187844 [Helobdella robusta]